MTKCAQHIAVLMACHNRRKCSLACLEALFAQELPCDYRLAVFLVDDGSTDGTSDAIRATFPKVNIIEGDGSLYWCGGMRRAWSEAARHKPSYYLLLNDDTILFSGALTELLDLCKTPESRVIGVGSIIDPITNKPSYGGVRKGCGLAIPTGNPVTCDTFNANCTIVTQAVYDEMGMLHSAYTHAMGDTDYGYQASKRGITILASGNFIGSCILNVGRDVWRDRSLSRYQRLKALQRPKGLPFREWMEFNRRNSGWKWPYYTISPILRILLGR